MSFGIIAAVLSALFFAIGNVFDKFVVEHRVKNPKVYAVLIGFVIFLINITASFFVGWSEVNWLLCIVPAISGILSGITMWFFYRTIAKEDISNVVGIMYLFPIMVAVLSFVFIHENISFLGYLGMLITITGTVMLTTKIRNLNRTVLSSMLIIAALTGITDFLIKVGTTRLPAMNALIINGMFVSFVMIGGMFIRNIRTEVIKEKRKIMFAFLGEPIYFVANMMLFLAMANLQATIVSSIAAIQPLLVILLEYTINRFFRISSDIRLKDRVVSISLIVFGVVLIYATGL